MDRAQCDLANADQLVSRVRELRPEVIVNAAAYTAVDRAESDAQLAHAVNARAPQLLAEEARRLGAYLVHFSTDYVFDGTKRTPYVESDATHPIQVYGRSKLEGEVGIRAAGCRHVILRTSWIYAHRGKNFALTMLEKSRTLAKLRVVADQYGAPTWAFDVAKVAADVLCLAERPEGTFHATAGGETSWCEFAREILRLAGIATPVEAVSTAAYPTPSARPVYTVLDSTLLPRKSGIPAIGHWKDRLSAFDQLKVMRNLGRLAEHDRG